MKRPQLTKEITVETFEQFYYLKEELVDFCRFMDLSSSGGKQEITKRITHYLRTNEKLLPQVKKSKTRIIVDPIELDTIIEEGFVCSEKHRTFFKSVIGNTFTFPVAFQTWLKENAGMRYRDAIDAYYEIKQSKKKTSISKQFEYNTYIRDYFTDQEKGTLQEAIQCWKYKKILSGSNQYEVADTEILKKPK